jgi:hypothetical protein
MALSSRRFDGHSGTVRRSSRCYVGFMLRMGGRVYSFGAHARVSRETPFELERAAFHRMLPDLRVRFPAKYVVISGGRVAGFGDSENEVAGNFFRDHPDTDAYVGFVGDEEPAYQIRPASR